MSKVAIEKANEIWTKLITEATPSSDHEFVLYVTVNEVSLISYALGCALGMEWGLETREEVENE